MKRIPAVHRDIVRYLVMALLLLTALPAPIAAQGAPTASPVSDDWPMYRGNAARTGDMPGPGIEGQPVELWRAEVEGEIHSAPAVANGNVYFGAGDGGAYALDAATGNVTWTFDTGTPISSSPAVADGVVFLGSDDGTLYALDAATGTEQWAFPGNRPNASVAVVDDVVYSGSEDGFLYAIDAASGNERWRAALGDAPSRSAAVADGVVYIGAANGVLSTFDAATGEPGWTFQTEGGGILTTPTIIDGIAFQPTFEGAENYVYAIDTGSGEQLWRFEQPANPAFLAGGSDGDLYFTPSGDTHVYALDAATGEEVWRFKTGALANAAPAIVDDSLYFAGNDGFLYAIETGSGQEVWRFPLEGEVNFGPVVVDGVAYVGTHFGYMYAIGGSGTEGAPATPEDGAATEPATPEASPVAGVTAELVWQIGQDDESLGQPEDIAIAPDGSIWVLDSDARQVHRLDTEGALLGTWPEPPDDATFVNDGPVLRSIAFDIDGNILIADHGNHRIVKLAPDGMLLQEWGSRGTGEGQFQQASDIVVDSHGNIYVIDVIAQRVEKFGPDGTYLATISGPGDGVGELSLTARIGIDAEDNLYVPDDAQVEVFTSDGSFVRSFGEGNLDFAVDAAVDAEGNVYVSDGEQNQVQVYDPTGELLGAWGGFGTEPGNFISADALALDGTGNIYVVDYGNRRIQKFAVTLQVGAAEAEATRYAIPAASPVTSTELATFLWETTGGDTAFEGPNEATIAPDGTVWVANGERSQVEIFTPDGTFVESWGKQGDGAGQFNFLREDGDALGSVAFAPDGSFYVADPGNHRIQHFDADRRFLQAWGTEGSGDGEFLGPWDLGVDSESNVIVSDDLRHDIQKFAPDGTFMLRFGGEGSGPGQVLDQWFMTVDSEDRIWVADGNNGHVQAWDNNGQFLAEYDADGTIGFPTAVAVDDQGRIFVTDRTDTRVVVLDPSGAVIGQWGAFGPGEGEFISPEGIALDGKGGVYVIDYESNRLLKFQVQPDLAP